MKNIVCIVVLIILIGCVEKRQEKIKESLYKDVEFYLNKADSIDNINAMKYQANLKAYDIIVSKVSDSINRKLLERVILNFYRTNNFKNMYISSKTLQRLSNEDNDVSALAFSHKMLGRYFNSKFIVDSAYSNFLLSKKLYVEQKNVDKIRDVSLDIAILQYSTGDFTNSEKTLFEILKPIEFKPIEKDTRYLALNLLGTIYCELHEFSKSLEYHNRALAVSDQELCELLNAREISLTNIGNIYQYDKQYKKSIRFYETAVKAENLFHRDCELFATLKDNIAFSRLKSGNYNELPQLFFQSLKIRDSLKIIPGVILSNIHLSEYYIFKKDTSKAIQYASYAYLFSRKNRLPSESTMALNVLVKIDKKNASSYAQQYIKINDSLQLAERRNRNKFARIAFETDEITTEKDNAVKQKWIILFTAMGIFLLGILLFIIKAQRAKQKELLFLQQQQVADESIYQLIHDRQIKIDEGRQLEKKRIARELHDGVMNRLTSTRLNLFILNKRKDDETIEKCLNFIDDIQNIEKEIRQVAHDLDSDIFSGNNSFNAILESLFSGFKSISTSELFVEIDTAINWETIEGVLKMNLYRMIQEILHNCNKYANAKNIYLNMAKRGESLDIVINDDGDGFDVRKTKKGIGLKNIQDRVKILSGKIDISSRKGKGTTIIVNLPIKPNNLQQHGNEN